ALRNNLDIAIERYNPDVREKETMVEEAVFDPSLSLELTNNDSVTRRASRLTGVGDKDIQRTVDLDVNFKQKLLTGATYELKFTNERLRTNSTQAIINPYYKSDIRLSITQPLLKNLGRDVNLSRIIISKNNESISENQLRSRIINVISDVQRAYWDLFLAREELDVRRLSLRLAKDLLDRNRAKVEVGILAPIEVIQAEAGVASREEGVILAEKTVADTEDNLKKITGLKNNWDVSIIPVDKPSIIKVKVEPKEMFTAAIENRPDYIQAKTEIINKGINKRLFENQKLPDLNLLGSIGLNGLDKDYGSNLERVKTTDYYAWEVGLNLSIPIGNRAAKGNYMKAKIEEEKARVELSNIEQTITVEVREAIRAVEAALKRIDATRSARVLAEKKLDAEEKKFAVGMSTSHDILTFQEELATAISNEKKAVIDYNKSLVNLERVAGITLKKLKVES
ncbi:MAG: TolC family protein, partial [Nitrospirota bacterium]